MRRQATTSLLVVLLLTTSLCWAGQTSPIEGSTAPRSAPTASPGSPPPPQPKGGVSAPLDCSTTFTMPTLLTAIFIDGFESGDTSAWSVTVPAAKRAPAVAQGDEGGEP